MSQLSQPPRNKPNYNRWSMQSTNNIEQTEVHAIVQLKEPSAPTAVNIYMNNRLVQLLVDTGSPVTIINKSSWGRLGKPQLQPADIHIASYTDGDIRLLGCAKVHVKCSGKYSHLTTYVAEDNRRNIMGRRWIRLLRLSVDRILHVNEVGKCRALEFDLSPEIKK